MIKEFREFMMRGNVLDLAVGIIIGAAFTAIVGSLVADIITPIIGLITGGVNFTDLFIVLRDGATVGPYTTLEAAKTAGAVTLNVGVFLNAVINFLIVAFVLFLIIRSFNRLKSGLDKPKAAAADAPPTTKECPYCYSTVAIKATRCPNCTSELK